jgi:NADH-quinone oxidoreductase subunit L
MYHLTTHAFFKALLFLGAGSVILALHHEQDIWKMGDLRKKMPVTFWTFLFGTLALCGVPPFSGFYSKDAILAKALHQTHENPFTGWVLFTVAVFVVVLTTFYMFRLFFVAFLGPAKSHASDHAHESPGVMVWPLRALAVFALIGGVIGFDALYGKVLGLEDKGHPHGLLAQLVYPFQHAPVAVFSGLAVVAVGFFTARSLYANAKEDPLPAKLGALANAMRNRFGFDEFYEATVIKLHETIAAVADWIDRWLVDGFCIGLVRGGTDFAGRALRLVQTGNLQTYAFFIVLGVAVVLWFVLGK